MLQVKQFLLEIGINIGMALSGFFGSLLLVGKQKDADIRTQLFSVIAGTLSANYVTPLVVDIANLDMQSAQFAIAFLVGFGGLKLVEHLDAKYIHPITKVKEDESDSN
jgi:hypothetical protein